MSSPSEIIVHCGLHKTGTTAIQQGIVNHFDPCMDAGIYLYNGNTKFAAHHGLAAQLSRYPAQSHEMLENLVQDIRTHNQPKTFISSEDFQCILTSPYTMRMFIDALQRSGADKVTFLIYLRNPIPYLTSMYITLLFFRHNVPFSDYFEAIMDTGYYRYRKWKLHFDYQEIAESLDAMNVDFAFRDYHQLKDGNAVSDVLAFLGAPHISTDLSAQSRKGVTTIRGKFTRYCQHVLRDAETHPSMFRVFEKQLAETKLYLPLPYKERLLERFRASMSFVDGRYGTTCLAVTEAEVRETSIGTEAPRKLSYLDVFHDTIQADLSPVIDELASGNRRLVSRQLMTQWGWLE